MQPQEAVRVILGSSEESPSIHIYRLPRRRNPHHPELWSAATTIRSEPGVLAFEVMEGAEYRFEWSSVPANWPIVTEPQEVFETDEVSGRTGRLRPRLSTGTVDASVLLGSELRLQFSFEVRSRKLDYQSEYRWMLRDVAEHMTELVMQRFAASRMSFEVDERRDAATLYEQFEFLRAALQGERLRHAFGRIVLAPHANWEQTSEYVPAARGVRGTSAAIRHLGRGGAARIPITHTPGLSSVPEHVLSARTEQTVDTLPNRFVRYALEHWRGLLWRLTDALSRKGDTLVMLRGRREIREVIDHLDEMLDSSVLRNVSRLDHFPSGNQVLQKREGYRDFYTTFIEVELAAMLTWRTQDAQYRAGQRDVAELYELWAFLQVGAIVGDLIGRAFLLAPLLRTSADGLVIGLQSGKESVLCGSVERAGRALDVALHFNRTFDSSAPGRPSWTRPMRPDITLSITRTDTSDEPQTTYIHFDAKYRVHALEEIFGTPADVLGSESGLPESSASTVRRDDLLKMHAYRDAIRRTAGAYVLYPGSSVVSEEFREFHELLPGLGAFVLRPTLDGMPSGAASVRSFIERVLDQTARRFTQYERSDRWQREIYGPDRRIGDYNEPPGRASVLLGFLKSEEHWKWVRRTRTYNLRTEPRSGGLPRDSALLQSQLLLLYCPATDRVELFRIVGEAEMTSMEAMARTGYPSPQGSYWCVQVSRLAHQKWVEDIRASVIDQHVQAATGLRGVPTVVDWTTVCSLKRPGDSG